MQAERTFVDKYAGVITFFLVYSYALSFVVDILFSTSNHVLVYFTALCGITILILSFFDIFPSFVVNRYELIVGMVVLVFLLFLVNTKYSYTDTSGNFTGVFNSFLVRGFPSAMAGLLIGKRSRVSGIDRFLVPIILFTTIGLLVTVSKNPTGDVYLFTSLGIDRQTMSYMASYMICWCLYFLCNNGRIDIPLWQQTTACKAMIYVMAFLNVWPLFAGGGRGAVVIVFFFALYYVFYRIHPFRTIKGIIGAIVCIIAIVFIWKYISSSTLLAPGMERITGFFSGTMDQSALERISIYQNAMDLFNKHPILGGGPGYALCEMGIWSHNIFLDLLADTGMIGTGIFTIWIISCFVTVFKNARSDSNIEAAFILGMSSFIMLCFSGSYISDGGIWFFLSYCIAYRINCYEVSEREYLNEV